jgi:hypothetical protein
MDPIPDLLIPNKWNGTNETTTKVLAKDEDPGKARIRMKNVAETIEMTDAVEMTVTIATIVIVQIVMSARKLGRLVVSPSL